MVYYSQQDPRWKDLTINGTSSTLGRYGCFITALGMLADLRPDEALKKLEKAGALNRDLIISDKAAQALGLEYYPPHRSPEFSCSHACIAEVDFNPYNAVKDQHFVVLLPGGEMIDPWTGGLPYRDYKIVSIRVFRNPNINTMKEKYQELADRKGWKTFEDAVKGAYDYREEREEAEKEVEELKATRDKLSKEIDKLNAGADILAEQVAELEKELTANIVKQIEIGDYKIIIKQI